MANTITAGNATNNGLALLPDNTGALNILTGSGSGTAAISIDASQNVTVAGTLASGALTSTGTITASDVIYSPARSLIRVNTVAKGSTNTAVLTWSTTVSTSGSDITYAPSATLGATFTVNANGVYAFSGSATFGSTNNIVITLNSAQLTTSPASLTLSTVLASATNAANGNAMGVSWSGYLPSGSVIRFQTETGATVSNAVPAVASAARIG